jgi:hypothetical protein
MNVSKVTRKIEAPVPPMAQGFADALRSQPNRSACLYKDDKNAQLAYVDGWLMGRLEVKTS